MSDEPDDYDEFGLLADNAVQSDQPLALARLIEVFVAD